MGLVGAPYNPVAPGPAELCSVDSQLSQATYSFPLAQVWGPEQEQLCSRLTLMPSVLG